MELRRVLVVTTLPVGVPPAVAAPDPAARATPAARVDFNDDGFADLAVGAPAETIGAADRTGAVNVLYGSATGLEPSLEVFYQGAGGAGGSLEDDDRFGSAVAKGDFDGDGIIDLAVGASGETVGASAGAAGAVTVFYAYGGGVLSAGEAFTQGSGGLGGTAEGGDQFGAALE